MDSPSLLAIHKEPIYPSVYHVFGGGARLISCNLLFSLLIRILFRLFLNFSVVVGLLGNESSDSNRLTLVTPKSENDVRLQATLDNQNPTGLPVGVVRN